MLVRWLLSTYVDNEFKQMNEKMKENNTRLRMKREKKKNIK